MVFAVQASGLDEGSSSERRPLLASRLSAAKEYSTFLLGMAEHDPPTVVIPSKGKARSLAAAGTSTSSSSTAVPRRPRQRDDDDDDSDDEHEDEGQPQTAQQQNNGNRNRLKGNDEELTVWSVVRSLWTNYDLTLDNVGSVARDHLANERTFLAWMRTSLALSSIGVAITQLFRLTSSSYTLPNRSVQDATASASTSIPPATTTIAAQDIPAAVSYLLEAIQQQQRDLTALGTSTEAERGRYHKLGKPIGGTFLILGLIFMALGGHRYISIQHQLSTKNHFPPARRSVLISSFLVMALLVATFVSILTIK
ncbi:hypothetical protein P389DRAFT_18668 [Cystobasidium minutum MCA 4210]|uniref:uncharacterized protein n=1 Tax=Cystobasidium minutum MCA 4210 TaxID=1397322 RepID=UPI0034CDE7EA|eukprot:jgi/Rhomi1/18668/CE18667_688